MTRRVALTAAVAALALALAPRAALAEEVRVGILKSGDVAAYREPALAFRDALEEALPGVQIDEYDMAGDRARGAEALRAMRARGVSLVFAVGAKAAYLSASAGTDIPVVFTSVIDWRSYRRVLGQPHVAGVALEVSAEVQLTHLRFVAPALRRVVVVTRSREVTPALAELLAAAHRLHLETVTLPVDEAARLATYANSGEVVTAVLPMTDPVVYTRASFLRLVALCRAHRLPLYAFSGELVEAGALVAIAADYPGLGAQAAVQAVQILTARVRPADLGVSTPVGTELYLNQAAARAIGLPLAPGLLKLATRVFASLVELSERDLRDLEAELRGAPAAGAGERDPWREAASEMALFAFLDAPVFVASKRPTPIRESPGVVTVITRAQMIASGARDLMDVLYQVPGFAFGVDVDGVVGAGFRGNWAHEGKVAVLVDGQEMAELLYSSIPQFGNHFPIEHIERIEIIRGPGSAIYGGFAELAVIHIITRGADQLRGASVAGFYGQTADSFGHRHLSVAVGERIGELSLVGSAFVGQGIRSDREYRDADGDAYDLQDNSRLDPRFVNAGAEYRGLRLRLLYDDYRTTSRDAFGTNLERADAVEFRTLVVDAQYDLRLSDRLVLTPRLSYKRQLPWRTTDKASPLYYDKTVVRYLAGAGASYEASEHVHLLGGVELFVDHAFLNDSERVGFQSGFGPDDEDQVTHRDVAAFAQLSYDHPIANLTLGARYELHSRFGQSFVPRFAVTRVAGRFHVKLLAAGAFRAPGVENLNISPTLDPERTRAFEAELGYRLGEHWFASANIFDTTILDAIVYSVDEAGTEGFLNSTQAGTRGLEYEIKMRYPRASLDASTSFYTARGRNEVDLYEVPGHADHLLGLPPFKIVLAAGLRLYRDLMLSPTVVWLGERYGYGERDAAGRYELLRFTPATMVSLYLHYPNLGVDGLEVGAGVHNLLDEDHAFLQPYAGGHPPLPGPSREVVVRLAYSLPF